jgi:hypothetical protein
MEADRHASQIDGDEEKVDSRPDTLDSNGPDLRDNDGPHGSGRSSKVESSGSYFGRKDLSFASVSVRRHDMSKTCRPPQIHIPKPTGQIPCCIPESTRK